MCHLIQHRSLHGLMILLMLGLSQLTHAGSDWTDLTAEAFQDRLFSCQKALKELQWEHTLWPEQNQEKPPFSEVFDEQALRRQIENSLQKQALLEQRFGTQLTTEVLQAGLDRMSANTRDPDRLQRMYQVLNNDPQAVAMCVVRPPWVEQQLNHQYYHDDDLHAAVKQQAEEELAAYLQRGTAPSIGQLQQVTYRLRADQDEIGDDELTVIELGAAEFNDWLAQAHHQAAGLQDHGVAFRLTEIRQSSATTIEVRSVSWPKQSLHHWVSQQSPDLHDQLLGVAAEQVLTLPPINRSVADNTYSAISNQWAVPNLPNGRALHTAVWTGNEMIIWGGSDFEAQIAGGVYNPATDTWQLTTPVNAPQGRFGHSAVWTGSDMIIWGGYANQITNLGKRYDPLQDKWTDMSLVNAPTVRDGHTTIWTGEKMIIWGGRDRYDGFDSTREGGIYDPATDSWTPISLVGSPAARHNHSAVWTGDEMIVWGGRSDVDGQVTSNLNTGARFDPDNNNWTAIADNPFTSRVDQSAIWDGSQMLIWAGGGPGFGTGMVSYDPQLDAWGVGDPGPEPQIRYDYTMIWTGSRVIIWGGFGCEKLGNNNYDCQQTLNTGLSYNPANDQWVEFSGSDRPEKRQDHTAIWTGTEMFVWGGQDNFVRGSYDNGGRYNPQTNSWLDIEGRSADIAQARNKHSAV